MICGLCGHTMTFHDCGQAGASQDGKMVYLCHVEDPPEWDRGIFNHSCYIAWTVYGARPYTAPITGGSK